MLTTEQDRTNEARGDKSILAYIAGHIYSNGMATMYAQIYTRTTLSLMADTYSALRTYNARTQDGISAASYV